MRGQPVIVGETPKGLVLVSFCGLVSFLGVLQGLHELGLYPCSVEDMQELQPLRGKQIVMGTQKLYELDGDGKKFTLVLAEDKLTLKFVIDRHGTPVEIGDMFDWGLARRTEEQTPAFQPDPRELVRV